MQSHDLSVSNLQERREQIMRGFGRANSAAVAVVLTVIALGLIAMAAAIRSERNARRAVAASEEARAELADAKMAQARADRISGAVGSRSRGLAAVATAAQIHPSLELRNEAIGLLALTDLEEQAAFWPHGPKIDEGSLDFDAELRRYAWGDFQGVTHVRSMESGQELDRLVGPASRVRATAFSPNGQLLGTRFNNGDFLLWDLASGQSLFATNAPFAPDCGSQITFSKDGQVAAVADSARQSVRIFDVPTGKELGSLAAPHAFHFDFNPALPLLAVSATGNLELWNWQSREMLAKSTGERFGGLMQWNSNGSRLACTLQSGKLWLWDRRLNQTNVFTGHSDFVSDVMFDPSDELVASRSWDGTTRLWNSLTGRLLLTSDRGYAMHFSNDGERLAFLRERSGVGFWRVYRSRVYRSLADLSPDGQFSSTLSFSPDARWLAASAADGIHIFDLAHGGRDRRQIPVQSENGASVFINPAGDQLIFTSGSALHRWRLRPGATNIEALFVEPAPIEIRQWPGRRIFGSAQSSDGTQVLISLDQRFTELIDLSAGNTLQTFTNNPGVHSVAVSPDHQWVVTATRHGDGPRLWNARTGELVRQLDTRDGNVRFSPDGKRLAIGFDYEVVVWETTDWKAQGRFRREITSGLAGQIEFSPDSKWLAMLRNEKTVQLVNIAESRILAELRAPHPHNVAGFAFSSDNRRLAVAAGTEMHLWDLLALQEELSKLGLAWGAIESPLAGLAPARQTIEGKFFWTGLLAGGAVLVALGFLVLIWQRNQQWLRDYTVVEALVAHRSQELELAQNEILQSQKMKALGALATGIAHDFNNLLSVIRMANKSVARETGAGPAIQEDLRDIEEAVLEGKNIVNSMLGYSREKVGSPEPYSVARVAEETVGLLSKQFLSGIELSSDFDRTAPPVVGSRARLKQMLLNLIVNAAEAMNSQGKLRLSSRVLYELTREHWVLRPRPADRYLELAVTDSGPGIPPEMVGRIFEPYFSTKTAGALRGTGLGLYLVYASAQAEGVGIAVESELGHGATFCLVMPMPREEPEHNEGRG